MCGTMCDLSTNCTAFTYNETIQLCGFGLKSNGIAGNSSDETSVFANQGKSHIIFITVYSEGYF